MSKKKNGVLKTVKKTARHLVSSAGEFVRNRYAPASGLNIANIASDVMMLKNLINAEKKRKDYAPNTNTIVGQVNNNGSGHSCEDITPSMGQGTTEGTRVGNSVKMSGTFGRLVVRNNASPGQLAPARFRHYIVEVKGDPYTNMSTFVTDFLSPNRYLYSYNSNIAIYDFMSERNPQNMKKFRVLRNKVFGVGGDTVSGMTQQNETVIKIKYKNLHLKWESDADNTPTSGQIISLLLCDRGNCGNTTSTLLGLSDTAVNTGFAVDRYYTHYLIDN